jgi:GABA(A) receptor-associated protein
MWKYFIKNAPTPSKSGYEFKMLHAFETRKQETSRIFKKYKDKIPVIIEKSDTSNLQKVSKPKFLLQKDLTIGQLIYIIRQEIKLDSTQSIFLFVNNTMVPNTGDTIEEIYNNNADKDGFLYITYSAEVAFGCLEI